MKLTLKFMVMAMVRKVSAALTLRSSHEGAGSAVNERMRPDVVAGLLVDVQRRWVAEYLKMLDGKASKSLELEHMMESCAKVANSVVQGSDGEAKRVAEYMDVVCEKSAQKFSKIDAQMCKQFAVGMRAAMQFDPSFNRHNLDVTQFCHAFHDAEVAVVAENVRRVSPKREQPAQHARAVGDNFTMNASTSTRMRGTVIAKASPVTPVRSNVSTKGVMGNTSGAKGFLPRTAETPGTSVKENSAPLVAEAPAVSPKDDNGSQRPLSINLTRASKPVELRGPVVAKARRVASMRSNVSAKGIAENNAFAGTMPRVAEIAPTNETDYSPRVMAKAVTLSSSHDKESKHPSGRTPQQTSITSGRPDTKPLRNNDAAGASARNRTTSPPQVRAKGEDIAHGSGSVTISTTNKKIEAQSQFKTNTTGGKKAA